MIEQSVVVPMFDNKMSNMFANMLRQNISGRVSDKEEFIERELRAFLNKELLRQNNQRKQILAEFCAHNLTYDVQK